MNPSLSIVVPLYNEEDNVEILYDEIRRSIDRLKKRYEIIFVDDGSSDATFQRLESIMLKAKQEAECWRVTRVIRFSRNFGQTAAMQAGFDHARGDVIVSMDGDLQNDPRDIPGLLGKLDEGYDAVCGWRKARQDRALTRVLPSRIANWLIRIITGVPIHDNGCSLRAYRGSVIRSIRLYSDMHRFISPMIALVGGRVTEMVVNHRSRKYGKTKYGISRIWKVLFDIITVKMLIGFRSKPLHFFATLSLPFLCGGAGVAIATIALAIRGFPLVVFSGMSFLLFFAFGNLLSCGLLAEYLVKMETQGYPGIELGKPDSFASCDEARQEWNNRR